ncbi:hypothetical protein D9758_004075 [Tetrapyrgos nigripes]|uniref:SCP2 domain-containing protein n=1 Tax=Tetrapyrgos nigripes TaxID=182062 RepID=A0A8H5LRN5_9AGAR|nr:hypothetical protein D9758_004075 [Tetrapyrgos nigripes]
MSDLKVDGFQSSALISSLSTAFTNYSPAEKAEQLKKVNGIFQLNVKNDQGTEAIWSIDLKKNGEVYKGPAKPKADVTISLSDETLGQLASGKLNGQKAFMTGKIKTKGNIMLATKLDGVFKATKSKL